MLLRRTVTRLVSLVAVLAAVAAVEPVSLGGPTIVAEGVPEVVDFNFHVKPILSDRCFKCHGPDDRARKAGLRLDRHESALAPLPSGRRAVVPGHPGRSELVARITSHDPDVMMPEPGSRLTLDEREKAILVRWIQQGAEWKPHWSFIPPKRPPVPDVEHSSWPRNDIDRFVLASAESRGLSPAPEASRETLIRRVSFDLTGLPPTLEEVDAFLADESPDAFARVVDRLLDSPAYGERMAAEWLDVARYADSHGYQDDGMRRMWPWRDWVIGAFNRNLPFDDFITWQLAGDLLSEPTREQRLATGFNRNHMQSQEGGVVPEEYRTEYVADRVNTLGRAFLGVTVECARCHDHKYDPVTQEEYYELFAFFNNVNETGQIPYSGVPSPTVLVPTPADEEKLSEIRGRILELEAELDTDNPAFDPGFERWLAAPAPPPISEPPGLVVHLPLDGARRFTEMTKGDPQAGVAPEPREVLEYVNLSNARQPARLGGDPDRVPETVPGRVGQAQALVGDSHIGLEEGVAFFERNDPFSLALWFRVERPGTAGPLLTRSGGLFNGNRGYEIILHENGVLTAGLHHVFPDNSIEIETLEAITPASWHHVTFAYDGSSRARGMRLFLDGRPARTRILVDHLKRSILDDQDGKSWGDRPGLRLGRRHDETLQGVAVDELRVYDRQLTAFEAAALGGGAETLSRVWLREAGERSPEQRRALREHYVSRVARGLDGRRAALKRARGEENALLTSLPEVMAVRERPPERHRATFVLDRGAYDAPTVKVQADTPQALGPLPPETRHDRLGLARWLLDPGHPLTARVLVNRYWALVFGRGLVTTPADFGSQGSLPSHPELLDWLAVTFVESDWDLKALLRQLVLSSTYRQSSVATPADLEKDRANVWLARGPSHRLSAEQIRDGALAASGLLVSKVGGPSVYPYQPAGLWEELATRNATTYEPGHGEDLHRRSLYTVWKRSTPPPSAIAFDAADRLTCSVKRQRTSTPLQSLVLMNDPQYLEASRALAERMILEGGTSPPERIAHGFRLLTGRRPDGDELVLLENLLAEERASFEEDREAAGSFLEVGERRVPPSLAPVEVAAYTVVATTVMNYDEVVFKR